MATQRRPLTTYWPLLPLLIGSAVMWLAAFTVFQLIVRLEIVTDFKPHAEFVQRTIMSGDHMGNFLYYLVVALAAGNSVDIATITAAATVVLASAVALKYWLSVRFLLHEVDVPAAAERGGRKRALVPLAALAIGVICFAFSFPTGHPDGFLYIGQVPANVWHNSTTIFLMPFAVALFWASYRFLATGEPRLAPLIVVLAALNIAAKPSFVIVFLCAFPALALLRFRVSRKTWYGLSITAASALVLAAQYYYIFRYQPGTAHGGGSAGVSLKPFHVWSRYSPNVPLSVAASIVFPAVATVAYWNVVRSSLLMGYAWLCFAVALAIYALLAETGAREFHANFSWQAIVSMYLLFLSSAIIAFGEWMSRERLKWRDVAVAGVLSLHALAGLAYLYRLIDTKSYL